MISRCSLFNLGGSKPFSLLFLAPLTLSIPDGLAIGFDLDVINLLIFVSSYRSPGSVPLSSALYYFLPSNSLEFNFFFSPQPLKVKLKLPILTPFEHVHLKAHRSLSVPSQLRLADLGVSYLNYLFNGNVSSFPFHLLDSQTIPEM